MPFGAVVCRAGQYAGRHAAANASALAAVSSSTGFASASAAKHFAPDLLLEPTHHVVKLNVDVQNKSLHGTATVTLRCNSDRRPRCLAFHAEGFTDVDVTPAGSDAQPLDFRYDGHLIHVSWRSGFGVGETRDITISYKSMHPVTGMLFRAPDEAYPDAAAFAITDNETERARYWMPCVDLPAVRPRWTFHLTSNSSYTMLANGVCTGVQDHGNGTSTAVWALDYPCPSYLTCVAVGEFVSAGVDDPDRPGFSFRYFAPKGTPEDQLMRSFDKTPAIMRWLEAKVGVPFPFPKYYQIIVPGIGGAMENISLVTWDTVFLLDQRMQAEWGLFTDMVNCHEMTHSYFGDAVVMRNFEHAWLKESWATYMEWEYLLDHHGKAEHQMEALLSARSYMAETKRYHRPIVTRTYDTSWNMFDMHLYPGGAWRIHMLRRRLGDAAFWSGVKSYVAGFLGRTVETIDFQRALESASGQSLTQFFEEWLLAPGFPKIKASSAFDADKHALTVTLEQTQRDAAAGIGLFSASVDVDIVDAAGQTSRQRVRFDPNGRAVAVFTDLAAAPAQIVVDADQELLHELDFNPGQDMLHASLLRAPGVHTRIWAAEQLVKDGSAAAIAKVRAAMTNETFYGVRQLAVKALTKAGTPRAVEAAAFLLSREEHAMALSAMCACFVGLRHDCVRPALLRVLEKPQLGHRGEGRALHALGSLGNPDDWPLLEQKLRNSASHNGTVQGGAARGIGSMHSAAGVEALRSAVKPGAMHTEARQFGPEALGKAASWHSKVVQREVTRDLLALLGDRDHRVILSAVRGLIELEATNAVGKVQAVKPLLAKQQHSYLDQLVQSLRSSSSSPDTVKKLSEQVDELQKRLGKMEEQLASVLARDASATKKDTATSS